MKKLFLIFLCAFSLIGQNNNFGQSLHSVQYTNENGLSDNTVFRIAQDPIDGHLWLGTDYGLNRFDGFVFKQYSFPQLSKSQSILAILPQPDSSIALSYYRDGVYFFKNDTLLPLSKSFVKDSIHDIFLKVPLEMVAAENEILMRSMGNLISLDNQQAKILEFSRFCGDICSDHRNGVFVANENGILQYSHQKRKQLLAYDNIGLIDYDGAGLFFSVFNSTFYWDMKDSIPKKLFNLPGKQSISALKADSRNRLWCSTHEGGLYYYHNKTLNKAHTLVGDSGTIVNDLFEDKEGNIWVATNSQGLFGIFTEDPITSLGNRLPYRTLLISNDGSLYVGALGKLFKWDRAQLVDQNIPLKYNESIYDICQLPEGDILAGGTFGMNRLSNKTNQYFQLVNGALAIHPVSNDKIMLGTFHGLFSYRPMDGHIQRENPSLRSRVNRFFNYKDEVWCLTDTGVFVWEGSHKWQRPQALSSFEGDRINDICYDQSGSLCLAATTGFYQIRDGNWDRISDEDGLPANLCHCLEMDTDGCIWIGTNRGVASVDTNGQLRKLNHFRTLARAKVRDMAFDNEGNLFLACEDAFLKLEPKKLFESIPNQPVLLEGIKSIKNTFRPSDREIQFEYNETPISVSFYTNSFKYAHDIEYEYRLVNRSTEWSKTKERTVTYASLSPGAHLFEVRAKHRASDEFSQSKILAFQVVPAFWMTTWFKALIVSLIAMVITSILVFRLKAQKNKRTKQLQIERRINHLKFQALSASMSPHFVQNVLSSIISYFHERSAKDAGTYIEEFSELIRLNLRHVQDSYIDLDEEIERLKLYLNITQRRHEGRFDYTIHSGELDIEEIMIPNMVIQPFVENAIWHGILPLKRTGKLDISFEETVASNHNFKVVIEDNGIGIHQKKKTTDPTGNSIGISTTIERVQLLHENNHIELEEIHDPISNEVVGTRVSIFLSI